MTASYPEHEKLHTVADKSQAIGEFLDWLFHERNVVFAYWQKDYLEQEVIQIEDLLAEYFEIDQQKLEQEKRDMLDELRRMNSR